MTKAAITGIEQAGRPRQFDDLGEAFARARKQIRQAEAFQRLIPNAVEAL